MKCNLHQKRKLLTEHTCWSKVENEASDQKPDKSSPADEEKDPETDSKDTGTDGELKVSTKTADSILTAIDEILGESKSNFFQNTNNRTPPLHTTLSVKPTQP